MKHIFRCQTSDRQLQPQPQIPTPLQFQQESHKSFAHQPLSMRHLDPQESYAVPS